MGFRRLDAADAFWRPSNQMSVLNTDLGKQLEAGSLGARLWRLRPGQASTKHRHQAQEEPGAAQPRRRMRGSIVLIVEICCHKALPPGIEK